MEIRITVRGLNAVNLIPNRLDYVMTRGIVRVVQKCRNLFVTWLQLIANEVSPPSYYPPRDKGGFERAWRPRNFRKGLILGNDKGIYSEVLEVGRHAGARQPPIRPLMNWLRRKGMTGRQSWRKNTAQLSGGLFRKRRTRTVQVTHVAPGKNGGLPTVTVSRMAPSAWVFSGPRKTTKKGVRGGKIRNWMVLDLKKRAFLLARAIKRRGQRPRLVATNALPGIANIAEQAIERELDAMLRRI